MKLFVSGCINNEVRNYMCLRWHIQRLYACVVCAPFWPRASLRWKRLRVSDSSSHFIEVTAWVRLARLLK